MPRARAARRPTPCTPRRPCTRGLDRGTTLLAPAAALRPPPTSTHTHTPPAHAAHATPPRRGQLAEYPALAALEPQVEKCKTRPAMLDGTHAGDYGFDPLGYATTDELLYFYMESEVKHSRLAMVGALGWIAAELNSGEVAPNLLNGHIFELPNLAATVLVFGLWSWNEHLQYPAQYLEHTPNSGRYNYLHYEDGPYVAGNYDFDPLNFYSALGDDAAGRVSSGDASSRHAASAPAPGPPPTSNLGHQTSDLRPRLLTTTTTTKHPTNHPTAVNARPRARSRAHGHDGPDLMGALRGGDRRADHLGRGHLLQALLGVGPTVPR